MRKNNVFVSLIAGALLVFGTTSASALVLSADFNFGASVFANTPTVNNGNDIAVALTAGDIIAIDINVDNTPGDTLTAIFASLAFDGTKLAFIGGGFSGGILPGSCSGFGCTAPVLAPGIGSPLLKPLSPFGQGTGSTEWLQVLAHTNPPDGTDGAGPSTALTLGLQVLAGVAAGDQLDIVIFLEPNSDIIGVPNGFPSVSPSFVSSVVNVPEPGTALLMSLGLIGLSVAGRRRA